MPHRAHAYPQRLLFTAALGLALASAGCGDATSGAVDDDANILQGLDIPMTDTGGAVDAPSTSDAAPEGDAPGADTPGADTAQGIGPDGVQPDASDDDTVTPVVGCGDGVTVDPEVCDDGVHNGDYGYCAADCAGPGPRCGDGLVDPVYEACDHGEDNGRYGFCAADCADLGPRCGDGVLDAPHERCDEGALNGSDGACAADCQGAPSPWIAPRVEPSALDTSGLSCTDGDLLAKYFRYRRRLRGDGTGAYPGFIAIGEGPGRSMPAGHRAPSERCSTYWGFGSCPPEDTPNTLGLYKWGDGTVWLGDYLSVLGLEHALFSELGLSTAETDHDLRLALAALDRVDLAADAFFPGVTPALDGFFLRDDVPASIMRTDDGGPRFPRDDGYEGYGCAAADLISSCGVPSVEGGSFTSQDQSIGLVFGLGVVAALVPDGVVVDGVDLRHDARAKVHRLVMAVRDNGWKVTAPDGSHPPNQWGGNAVGFSNQLSKAADDICGDEFGVSEYRNLLSRTVGQAAWDGIQAIWEQTHAYNRTMVLRLAALTSSWGPSKIAKRSMSDGKDFFALVYALVRGVALEPPYSDWRVESLLRTAPCSGPCWGTEGCSDTPGWRGESRTINPGGRLGSRHRQEAEYNGMDYMSLFAAWFLYNHGAGQVVSASAPPSGCAGKLSLDAILAGTVADGSVWDPTDACAGPDLQRSFCGRPFGAWVDDAAHGRVTIYAGGARWSCAPGGACTLSVQSDENTGGDDLILGTPGDDDLSGGGGNDCLVGFGGNDELRGNQGYDWLDGGPGDDELYGENSGIVVDGEGDVLHGGPGNDSLRGGPGKDELYGEEGDDDLEGRAGDDFMLGGPGNDALKGSGGDDYMQGGPGDDSLIGDTGGDEIFGNDGRDKLDGEGGDDYLHGGLGPDFLRGGTGDDTLVSGDDWGPPKQLDDDRLCGNGGDDVLWAGWDGDECLGGGWFLGGTDEVHGCDDETASTGDCDNGAFNDW